MLVEAVDKQILSLKSVRSTYIQNLSMGICRSVGVVPFFIFLSLPQHKFSISCVRCFLLLIIRYKSLPLYGMSSLLHFIDKRLMLETDFRLDIGILKPSISVDEPLTRLSNPEVWRGRFVHFIFSLIPHLFYTRSDQQSSHSFFLRNRHHLIHDVRCFRR